MQLGKSINRSLYIFDLDGTLALIEHRQHFIDRSQKKQHWKSFYEACDKDLPNIPVISILNMLLQQEFDVQIWSGRSSIVRGKTLDWIAGHTQLSRAAADDALTMREEGDSTPDNQLKQSWLNRMLIEDRDRLVAVFDDRQKVVDMWRANGIVCFQVAPGDF